MACYSARFKAINIGGDFATSDSIKRLAYHEFGHGSHFATAGPFQHRDLITASVASDGHGDPTSHGGPLLALSESWVEHIGRTMLIRQYPITLSNNSDFFADWSDDTELLRNETPNHVPIGLYTDLIDGINFNEFTYNESDRRRTTSGNVIIPNSLRRNITDPVNNAFTNNQFGAAMNSSISSVPNFRDFCLANRPGSVSSSAVIQLFNEYGY